MPHQEPTSHRINQLQRLQLANGLDASEDELSKIVLALKDAFENIRLDPARPIRGQLTRERRFWSEDIELKLCSGPGIFGKTELKSGEIFVILREGPSYMVKLSSDHAGLKVVEKSLGPME